MALPHQNHFQLNYQQPQQSKDLRNLYAIDGQISPFFNTNSSAFPDHTQPHQQQQPPPYALPFHVAGLAPGPGPGLDLGWNYGEPERKKQSKEEEEEEQDLFFRNNNNNNNNNSQISSIDFLQARSVSTGLGLSLDNNNNNFGCDYGVRPSGENNAAALMLSLMGDEVERELLRQDAEIDRFLKVQGDRLRQAVLEKVQADQFQTVSLVEEKILQKLREKEAEVESINKKNMELEDRMEQLSMEAGAWQQRARYNENMITALRFNLHQVYAQSRESKEGCGDSEVDDTASCCNGQGIDFHLLCKDNNDMKELMTCKVCRVKEVCMLLIPCKHLCLCKDCESNLSFCPVCKSSKFIGMEVYM